MHVLLYTVKRARPKRAWSIKFPRLLVMAGATCDNPSPHLPMLGLNSSYLSKGKKLLGGYMELQNPNDQQRGYCKKIDLATAFVGYFWRPSFIVVTYSLLVFAPISFSPKSV